MSTSTAGPHVSHCVEGSSMVRTDSHSPSETEPQTSVLPEDIGQRTAMTLIEEIVRVSLILLVFTHTHNYNGNVHVMLCNCNVYTGTFLWASTGQPSLFDSVNSNKIELK